MADQTLQGSYYDPNGVYHDAIYGSQPKVGEQAGDTFNPFARATAASSNPVQPTGGNSNNTGVTTGGTVTVDGKPIGSGSSNTSQSSPPDANTENQNYVNSYNNNPYTQAVNDAQQNVLNIGNGVFKLNPDEQAQIDAMNLNYDKMKQTQLVANKNFEGGTDILAIASGRNRYAPELALGEHTAAVQTGLDKLNTIDTQRMDAVSKLRYAFQNKDYDQAKQAYDMLQKSSEAFTKQIQDLHTSQVAFMKELSDQKAAADKVEYDRVTKPIQDLAASAAKNGASPEAVKAIGGAKDLADAMEKSVGYLNDPTSPAGMYSAYVLGSKAKGVNPMSAGDFLAAQKYADALATAKAHAAYSYTEAYNSAAGKLAADAKYASSDGNQQKLAKEYTANLIKELNSRTGDLGVQNAKVSQAIHLKALIDQNKTTDSKGNTKYNLTNQQLSELAIGAANLLAGSTGASEKTIESITSKTMKGDWAGALQYATGVPQKGSSDALIKVLDDTIARQGAVAEDLRDNYMAQFRASKPADLNDDLAKKIEGIQAFTSIKHPEKNVLQAEDQAKAKVIDAGNSNPKLQTQIQDKLHSGYSYSDLINNFPEWFK